MLPHTGYLETKDYGICGRCFQLGIPPSIRRARYAGKAEDTIRGIVRNSFILLEPISCSKCGANNFEVFVDAEFIPILRIN